jgi:hypothetical protein
MILNQLQTEKIFEGPGQSHLSTYVLEISIILIITFIFGYLFSRLLISSHKREMEDLRRENEVLTEKIRLLSSESKHSIE